MKKIRGGYRPSGYDGRDKLWNSGYGLLTRVRLPHPPPKDQGERLDSCTAMAVTTAMEMLDCSDGSFVQLSPLFNYYFSRVNPRYLGLVELRKALDAASVKGVCELQYHNPPNTPDGALLQPTAVARENAFKQALIMYDANIGRLGYEKLDSGDRLRNWKSCLSSGRPVIVGLYTQESYWDGKGMGGFNSQVQHPPMPLISAD